VNIKKRYEIQQKFQGVGALKYLMTTIQKLRRILIRKEKLVFLSIIGLSVLLSVSEIFSIGILVPIINLFLNPEMITTSTKLRTFYTWIGATDSLRFLTLLVIVAIFLFLWKAVLGMAVLYWQQKSMAAVQSRLSGHILWEYLHRPYKFHLINNSSVLFKNINVEVSQFVSFFLNSVIVILSESIILCGVMFVVFYLYPEAAIIAVMGIGIVVIGLNKLLKRRMARYADDRNVFSGLFTRRSWKPSSQSKRFKYLMCRTIL